MEWKQWEGQVIDERFHLRQYLGGSAHSGVFLTECGSGTPQTAVIKLVPADSGKAEAWILRRELAARLSHPGLQPVLHFGTCHLGGAGMVYAVMEQADEDLSQVIAIRPLDPAETREMLVAVLEALAYIHTEGFVHGCLTPGNVMAAGDRIRISSDGLLRIGESNDDLWARSANDAPEGRSGVTPAGDVWSLGMTLVEVLTQRAPAWDAAGTNDPHVPEDLPAPFLDIARRCLRSDPRLRCTLAEISAALQPPASRAPQARPVVVEAVPIVKPAAAKTVQKSRYLLPAVAGLILGGLIFAGAVLTRGKLSNSPAGSEMSRSEPSAQPAAQEAPATAPVTAAAKEAPPPSIETKPDLPEPAPAPAVSAPVAENSTAKLPAGDVVDRVIPDVPAQILGTIRGRVTVRVRVKVESSGTVADAELDSHAGSKYFDRVALEAARRWKFNPVSDAGNGGESAHLLRFEFRTNGCEAFSESARP
jgi:TonB family protein